jgi:hypothetical protein
MLCRRRIFKSGAVSKPVRMIDYDIKKGVNYQEFQRVALPGC